MTLTGTAFCLLNETMGWWFDLMVFHRLFHSLQRNGTWSTLPSCLSFICFYTQCLTCACDLTASCAVLLEPWSCRSCFFSHSKTWAWTSACHLFDFFFMFTISPLIGYRQSNQLICQIINDFSSKTTMKYLLVSYMLGYVVFLCHLIQ